MAGLLDYLTNGSLLQGFFPEQNVRDIRPRADTPLFDITMGQGPQGWQVNLGRPGALTGDTFDQRFGAMQPPAQQPQAAPAPQMQPAERAQQAFAMPDSTYAFGGQMVPAFGQAQAPVSELSAAGHKSSVAVPNDPATAQPTVRSELFAAPPSNSMSDKFNDFIGVLNPSIGAQNDSKKAQRETAKGMLEYLTSQGMDPNRAASIAVMAARNPKVLEEIMKPHPNMEAAIASQFGGQGGGNATQRYADFLRTKKAAETAGETQGKTQAEAQIALPGSVSDFQQTMQTIEELRNHKGRNSIGWHGPTANIPQDMLRGSEAFGAAKLEERLKSRVFGQQIEKMVGLGALSNIEGQRITDAVGSLDRGLKKDEYNRTLNFIQESFKNGLDKLATKAGQPAPFGWKGNDGWNTVPMPGSSAPVRIRQVQ